MNQVIHQVGPVYGVRDYLSSVRKAWEGDLDDIISLERAQHALKSSKDPQVIADAVQNQLHQKGKHILLSYTRINGKRLGKSIVLLNGFLVFSTEIEHIQSGRVEEVLAPVRFVHRIERDRDAFELAHANIFITRHALERLYEREGLPTGGVPEAIRETITDLRHNLAFAISNELRIGNPPEMVNCTDDSFQIGMSSMLVPFGAGLLVIETGLYLARREIPINTRFEARRSGIIPKGDPVSNKMARDVTKWFPEATGHINHTGRTYLSRDILRPEQVEYLDAFKAEISKVDINTIATELFDGLDQHKAKKNRQSKDVQRENSLDTKLHSLLPKCLKNDNTASGLWLMR